MIPLMIGRLRRFPKPETKSPRRTATMTPTDWQTVGAIADITLLVMGLVCLLTGAFTRNTLTMATAAALFALAAN